MPADHAPAHARAGRALRAALAAAGALLVALVAAARQADVVERGALLPFFETYEVARVRLAGVELYVDTSSGAGDVVTAATLALAAAVLLAGAWAARADPSLRGTMRTAGLGAAFLAADDLLAVHETVGHNLGVLAALPVVDHPDDVVIGLYALVAAAFAWRHRALLAGAPRRAWAVCAVAGGAAVGHDLLPLHASAAEEALEVVAGAALLAATALVVRAHVPAPRAQPRTVADAGAS